MNKLFYWVTPLLVVLCVVVIGSSFLSVESASEDPYSDAPSTPSSATDTKPSVLSTSANTTGVSPETDTEAPSYEQILASAAARCRQAGYQDGTSAMNDCMERETSQIAH